jgi:predicted molibdopterin-dependent oxidoreductase YjgC
MFRSLRTDDRPLVSVIVNGQNVDVPPGQTDWSAMALSGQKTTRKSALNGQDRSAYCAMGVCFECLVNIDGQPNQQACLRQVAEGMRISTQNITEQTKANL